MLRSMQRLGCSRCGLRLACLSVLAWTAVLAGEVRLSLSEQLNRRWSRECVTYPFSAPAGTCVPPSVQLLGPTGSLPVQLAAVECWPGTAFVKTASLVFVVDELAPLATHAYTVTYGPNAAPQRAVAADLVVTPAADRVEATTSRFGVRLLLGEKSYEPPVVATTVPGPVLGMRLADGTWFGGSRLYGDTPVAGYSARLLDAGPVVARVECVYRYAGGQLLHITVRLNTQGDRAYYATSVPQGQPKDGWDLRLSGLPPLAFQFMPEQSTLQPGTHAIKGWKERDLAAYPPGLISNLTPWGDWVSEFTQTTLYLAFLDTRPYTSAPAPGDAAAAPAATPAELPDGRELVIRRLDAAAWVTPGSGIARAQAEAPLMKAADGALFLRLSNKPGARSWSVGENPSSLAKLARVLRPSNVMQDDMEDLDVVKDLVLDWPATAPKHPSLFLSAEDFAKAGARNPAALKRLQEVKTLREDLSSYVFFDTMRHAAAVICQYDALIDSELIPAPERKLLRAQMAYLAYRLASPANWSAARGYNTGNPNMTVAHLVNQGLAACLLSDHPMAKEWAKEPIAAMDGWLDKLDAAGHWPESSGYARVAESKMVYLAIASQRAGLHPFLDDPRFKRLVLYFERTLTPPDPLRVVGSSPDKPLVPRVTPPYGRGGNGGSIGIGGMVAKATEKLDPALSRLLQWSYAGTQFSTQFGEDMFGYDQLMTDSTLPTERPDWRSERLPSVGALFRSGVGTPEENYLLLVGKNPTNPDGEIWPSEVGAVTSWFDHGQPLTRAFYAGHEYPYLHGLMLNRVMLASSYAPGKQVPGGYVNEETMTGFATLPRLDYLGERYHWTQSWNFFTAPPPAVRAFPAVAHEGVLPEGGVTWHRQALYVRDALPGGKNYLVLRDTLSGNQPTQWQFWTISKGLAPVDGKRLVADADVVPEGVTVAAAPVALSGNRFIATGQFGRDLEYYVASPTDTPRHTLRHGYEAKQNGVVRAFRCEQDLLHLQLPGDGVYFVALVPRTAGETAPTFATLGDGKVIKVSGPFGTDYAFLADNPGAATAEGVTFFGTAASVQDRAGGLVLALATAGAVACKGHGLTAPMAANLHVAPDTLTLTLAAGHAGGLVRVQAPDGFHLGPVPPPGVAFEKAGKTEYRLTMPDNINAVVLIKGP